MSKLIDRLCAALCGSKLRRKDDRIEELEAENEELRRPEWPDIETTTVSKDEVEDALSELDGWGLRQSYWWDDRKYHVPNVYDFGEVALRDSIDQREYVDEYFDCDNYSDHITAMFARRYRVNAVGTVISPEAEPPHAFNVVIVEEEGDIEARLWEPQADEWITDGDDPKYTLDGALIRI